MMKWRFLAAIAIVLTTACSATSQTSVKQSGSVTPGHAVRWIANGVVADAGTATSSFLTSIGVQNSGGPGICLSTGPNTGPYNQLCFQASTSGNATISYNAFGGATGGGITFNINGSVQGFLTATLPVTPGDYACFTDTSGNIESCNAPSAVVTSVGLTMPSVFSVANSPITSAGTIAVTANGTSGGIPYFNSATTMASSGVLGANQIVLGGGAGAAPTSIATLPVASGGTGANTLTNHGLLIGQGTSAVAFVGPCTSGYFIGGAGASADPTCQGFLQAGSGGATRTWQDKARDTVNVKDFGAVCDGSTDDTAAFNNAVATGLWVQIPAATCRVDGPVNITVSKTRLSGAGLGATILTSTSTTAVMIAVSQLSYIEIDNLRLTRSVTATSGAHGISVAGTCGVCNFHDLLVEKQFVGLNLSATEQAYLSDITVQTNESHGILIQNTAAVGNMQWIANNLLSQFNVGSGFVLRTDLIAGPSSSSVGTWSNIFSFANSGHGIAFIAASGIPIQGIRLIGSFFGQDGNHEVYLDTYNTLPHTLQNVFGELAGTGTTGPALGTAASDVGSGFYFTTNNGPIETNNLVSYANSQNGLYSEADSLSVIGGMHFENGQAAAATYYGIQIGIAGTVRIVGSKSYGTNQIAGFRANAAVIDGQVTGNDFTGTGGGVSDASTGTLTVCLNQGGGDPDCSTAWVSYTATPTCGDGTVSSTMAKYKLLGKTVFFKGNFVVTAIGTTCAATNTINFVIPFTAEDNGYGVGREIDVTGKGVNCRASSGTTVGTCRKDDVSAVQLNERYTFSGIYERP